MIKAFCSITVPTLNLAETKNGMQGIADQKAIRYIEDALEVTKAFCPVTVPTLKHSYRETV